MHSKHDEAKGSLKVFEIRLPEHDHRLQKHLFRVLFKDQCSICTLPSYVEIGCPPEVDLPPLKQDIGKACGFWLARNDLARSLCAEFQDQFDARRVSDDACFLILRNVLTPESPSQKK